ncbi:MAG: PD-(D/E)XK nuclease family protein [Thiomicrorhabdus sp.]|nr:PD-(D/E)XK nuclease family protein [Thiomicrorhabdus sp.]
MNVEEQNRLLNEVSGLIKTHKKYSNQQGEFFNIFTILRMERREVETHSRFIYELLNPKGLHGQGDLFLKLFLDKVLGIEDAIGLITPLREDVTESNRRIDFTIKSENYQIGIEMKIDAGDQGKQLFDYYDELKRRKEECQKVKLFYLTLHGSKPSNHSLKTLSSSDYEKISFKDNVMEWINECIAKSATKGVLREALIQYQKLIQKLTGRNEGVKMEVVNKIASSPDTLTAAIAIGSSLECAKANVQSHFWNALINSLSRKQFSFEFYDFNAFKKIKGDISDFSLSYYKNNNRYFGYVLDLGRLVDNRDGVHLIVYIEVDWRVYFGLGLAKSKDGVLSRLDDCKNEKYAELKRNLEPILKSEFTQSLWLTKKTFLKSGLEEIHFKYFNSAAISLADATVLEQVVDNSATLIADIIDKINAKNLTNYANKT